MTETTIVEIARIRLAEGADEAALRTASDRFQAAFLAGRPGFLRRELLHAGGRDYIDLVHWQDQASAEAVMAAALQSPDCAAYFAVMEMQGDPAEGVSHCRRVAVYG